MQTLMQKITERSAHVSVIGLGYVGLPLALGFAQAGYQVTGIDTDPPEDRWHSGRPQPCAGRL